MIDDLANRVYIGDGRKCQYEYLEGARQEMEPYIAPDSLAEAVNVALYLRRPLLLEGDPGCGKTRLAYSIAYELGFPIKECYIGSGTRAQDLLYNYDALRRLYDIQEVKGVDGVNGLPPRKKYVELKELGDAIRLSRENIPSVVLIDEIDKADLDFPNDLLLVLDRLWFNVKEIDENYRIDAIKNTDGSERREIYEERKKFLPLIIVTSNREKELPKPFLRRCLFYYIEFPNERDLRRIVDTHFPRGDSDLLKEAIDKFWQLRLKDGIRWRKIPSTSELIDWLRILQRDLESKKIILEELVSCFLSKLPHLETLVKTQSDLDALKRLDEQND